METDLVHTDSLYYALFAVGNAFTLVAVLQRLWVRWLEVICGKRTQHGSRPKLPVHDGKWSDAFLLAAWAFSLATQITLFVLVIISKAVLTHIGNATADQITLLPVAIYAAAPVYLMCTCFAKFSLLRLYMALDPNRDRNPYRIATWIVMGIVGLFTGILTGMLLLACRPIRKGWEPSVDGHCPNYGTLHIIFAAGNAITEIACMIVPIKLVLEVKVSAMKKVVAVAMLASSCSPFFTSIVRIFYIRKFYESNDPTWDGAPVVLCIMVEANLYIICGCIPSMGRVVRDLFGQTTNSSKSYNEVTSSAAESTDRPPSSYKRHEATADAQKSRPSTAKSTTSHDQQSHQRQKSTTRERSASFSESDRPKEHRYLINNRTVHKSKSDSDGVAGVKKPACLSKIDEDPDSYHGRLREVTRATTDNFLLDRARRGSSFE